MNRRYSVPALQVPAAGERAQLELGTDYLLNSDKLKVATYPVEEDGERVYIVIEDSAP
ncbi:hypothetical protein [Pseudomonas sp. ML96]|uniref:hypothetical protein n=1 Tax=Pseudomonas sp. ML96 TaxID=1523503 RepID=UPI0015A66047|nr:hypothetical protein [Pseudomonas sp. ML96]